MRFSGFVALALLCSAAAVGNAQRPAVRDSAGIRIVMSTAPAWTAAQSLRIDGTPRLAIGTQAGTE